MPVPWDDQFERLLRDALPLLPADAGIREDTCLKDHGMDSMASIDLLLKLEEHYGVAFPDEALTSATFAAPGALWSVLTVLRDATTATDRG
jgi:diaminopimelate decarboxylase